MGIKTLLFSQEKLNSNNIIEINLILIFFHFFRI